MLRSSVVCLLADFLPNSANWQLTEEHNTYRLLYIYSIPPNDGLQICPKHVEVYWRNKLRINSVSGWFLLCRCWRHAAAAAWLVVICANGRKQWRCREECRWSHAGTVQLNMAIPVQWRYHVLTVTRRVRNEKLHKHIQSSPCDGLSVYRLYELGKHWIISLNLFNDNSYFNR